MKNGSVGGVVMALALVTALAACDGGSSSSGTDHGGQDVISGGSDTGGSRDPGGTTDTGASTDTGATTDPGATTDTGGTADTGGGPDGGADQTTSRELGGEKGGGSLESADGMASISIPAGALDTVTTITVTVLPKTAETTSNVYDFGPDGLEFQVPASLNIKYAGPPLAEGKKAVLAWYDEKAGQWVDIPGSQLLNVQGDSRVLAPVEHFTRFAIVIRDDQVVIEGCVEDIDAFQACGGDPTGTWKFQDACLQLPMGSGGGECPGMTQQGDIQFVNLTMEFQGGQLTTSMDKTVATVELNVPKSCLPGVPCSALEQDGQLTCTDTGSACQCTGTQEEVPQDSPKTVAYTVSGGDLSYEGTTAKFCVQGDELRILQEDPEDGSRLLLIMKRQ